jgi:hypothetical protein
LPDIRGEQSVICPEIQEMATKASPFFHPIFFHPFPGLPNFTLSALSKPPILKNKTRLVSGRASQKISAMALLKLNLDTM